MDSCKIGVERCGTGAGIAALKNIMIFRRVQVKSEAPPASPRRACLSARHPWQPLHTCNSRCRLGFSSSDYRLDFDNLWYPSTGRKKQPKPSDEASTIPGTKIGVRINWRFSKVLILITVTRIWSEPILSQVTTHCIKSWIWSTSRSNFLRRSSLYYNQPPSRKVNTVGQ